MIRIFCFVLALMMWADPTTQPNTISSEDQKRANELMSDGWALWQKQQYDDAAEKFQQSIDLDPANSNAWNGLGWSHFNGGQTAQAEAEFKKCVEIEPQHAAGLNGLGQIYLMQGKMDQAELWLLKAAPAAPAAWYGLAHLYLLQEKWDDAKKWLVKIQDSKQVEDQPTFDRMMDAAKNKKMDDSLRALLAPQMASEAQQTVAGAMKIWRDGNLPEAKRQLDDALEKWPEDANVHNACGWFKLNGEHDVADAQQHFEKALQLSPADIGAQTGLATCFKMIGRVDDAIELWKKVVEQYPNAMNAAYSLADAYMDKGDFKSALPLLQNLAKQWPDNEPIQTALAKAKEGMKK